MDAYLLVAPACTPEMPTIGPVCLYSYLKEHGYAAAVLDVNLKLYHQLQQPEWWKNFNQDLWISADWVARLFARELPFFEQLLAPVIAAQPKIIGLTVWYSNLEMSKVIAAYLRERCDATIVFGGPDTYRINNNFRNFPGIEVADLMVLKEGEETLRQLCAAPDRAAMYAVDGIAYLANGRMVRTRERQRLPGAELPDLDYACLDPKEYVFGGAQLPAYFSRGCVNRCIFCDERLYWGTFYSRSGEQVFAEVMRLKERYPYLATVAFCDSLINGDLGKLLAFAELMVANRTPVAWEGNAVVRKGMDYEYLHKLYAGGCRALIFGVETVAAEVLRFNRKLLSLDVDLAQLIRDAKRAGIHTVLNFMFGLPGETRAQAEENIAFIRANREYIGAVVPTFAFCNLSPGSDAYENPRKYGLRNVHTICYWESRDGSNTYPERLRRFEAFIKVVAELGLDSNYPFTELQSRDRELGLYYAYQKDYGQAREFLERALIQEPENERIKEQLDLVCDRLG